MIIGQHKEVHLGLVTKHEQYKDSFLMSGGIHYFTLQRCWVIVALWYLHQYLIPVCVQSGQTLIEEMAVSQGWYSQCHTKYDCFDSNQIQIHIQIQMQIRIQIQTQIHTDTVTDTYKDRNRHIGRSRLISPQTDITKGWQHNFIKAQEQYKLSFLYRHYFQYIERKCD